MHGPTLSYYDNNAERFFEETLRVDMASLYHPFLSLLPRGAHILDAGCGSGRDSLYFLRNGYTVTAFDASEKMVSMASDLLGQTVLRTSFDRMRFDRQFDGVWACASLLHVPRSAMYGVLARLTQHLKPHGAIYASFKYGDGEGVRDGRFFNDYNENGLRMLLHALPELTIVDLWQTLDLRSGKADSVWLNALIHRGGS